MKSTNHAFVKEQQLRRELVRFGRMLHAQQFVAATDGNLSVRLDAERLMITPSMANHGVLSYAEDLLRAYMKMEVVEHYARIVLATRQLGMRRALDQRELDKLLQVRSRYAAGVQPAKSPGQLAP